MLRERATRILPAWSERGFLYVLVGSVVAFSIYPFVAKDAATRVVMDAVLTASLVGGVLAYRPARPLGLLLVVLGAADVAANVVSFVHDDRPVAVVRIVLDLAFLATTTLVLLAVVLRSERVTATKIYAAVAVYLLIGFTWALVYDAVELAEPGSFNAPSLNATPDYEPYMRQYESWSTLYFSFVTLTTLGFGDVTPTTVPARTLVWLEAVIGQMYVAVLVGRLVGLQITHAERAPDAGVAPEGAASADERHLAEWRALLAAQQRQIELLREQVELLRGATVNGRAPPAPDGSPATGVADGAAPAEIRHQPQAPRG